MATHPIRSDLSLDDDGRLDADIMCRRCGYNLRGLAPDRRCPECGLDLRISLVSDELQFCSPDWVATLAQGTNLIGIGVLLSLLPAAVCCMIPDALTALIALVPALLPVTLGLWLVTTPEPYRRETSKWQARKIVRIAMPTVYCFIVGIIGEPRNLPLAIEVLFRISFLGLFGISLLGLCVTLMAAHRHMSQLAARLADPYLNRQQQTIGGLIRASSKLMALLVLLALPFFIQWSGMPLLSLLLGVLILMLAVWSLDLLFRYRRAFSEAARQARANWAAASSSDSPP